jgi:ParB family transcriptional regulator, chromosome partitioning protein
MSDKLKTIVLSQLKPSNANVRKTGRLADIEQLAASIEANGLLENLVVQPVRGNKKARIYEVVAGGRRLAALNLLAKRKKIARDHPVPCLIKSGDATMALETSLAENFVRTSLHPADQFEAFADLSAGGASAEDIAAKYGVTPTFVLQRIKLAAVSPRLVAEYRKGAMTLEQLTAFTLADDHTAQEAVWFDSPYADLPAETIRRLLTRSQVEGSDKRARFVGGKAYEAAGGIIVRDLFDLDGEGYFADSQLLDRLVAERLDAAAKEMQAEGWQWVEVHPDWDYAQLARYGRAESVEVVLSKTEEKHLGKLAKRYDELVAALEENGGDSAELDTVSAEIDLLQAKKEGWLDEVKVHAGSVVSLGPDGVLKIARGLLQPQASGRSKPNGKSPVAEPRERANGYSESVLLELSAERTAALQEVVAGQPETALTALLYSLVGQLFYSGSPDGCVRIVATMVSLDRASEVVGKSKAAQAFQARHTAWKKRLPERDNLWAWLGKLKSKEQLELLAFCVATTINALHGPFGRGGSLDDADALAAVTGLDMGAWWQPTRATILDRLTKAEIMTAVSEGVSASEAKRLDGLKKERMAKKAETLLAGSGWLPAPLRSAASVEAASS